MRKINNRINELRKSYFDENNKYPSELSEKLIYDFLDFLNKIKNNISPSITLSPNGYYSVRYIINDYKIVLSFYEKRINCIVYNSKKIIFDIDF